MTLLPVCCICRRAFGPDYVAHGLPVPPQVPNQTHALCRGCAPGYLAEQGISDEDQAQVLAVMDGKELVAA